MIIIIIMLIIIIMIIIIMIIIIIYKCNTKKSLCSSGWCSCNFPHLFSRDVQFGCRADNRLFTLRSSVVILKYMAQQYID